MRSSSRIRSGGRLAVVATAVAGLATAGQSTAFAAESQAAIEASVSVTPSTELVDDQHVTVTVAGLSPEAMVGQCAFPDDALVCNPSSMAQFPTDADGAGTMTVPVHKTFEGYTITDDGTVQPWGAVDCAVTPCAIGATDGVQVVTFPISFG